MADPPLACWQGYVAAVARRRVRCGRTAGTSLDADDLVSVALVALWRACGKLDAAGWPKPLVAVIANRAMGSAEQADRAKGKRLTATDPGELDARTVDADPHDHFAELLTYCRPSLRPVMDSHFRGEVTLTALGIARDVFRSAVGQELRAELGRMRERMERGGGTSE